MQKWNLRERLGKEHLDYKKSTVNAGQSQQVKSMLVKVNSYRSKMM